MLKSKLEVSEFLGSLYQKYNDDEFIYYLIQKFSKLLNSSDSELEQNNLKLKSKKEAKELYLKVLKDSLIFKELEKRYIKGYTIVKKVKKIDNYSKSIINLFNQENLEILRIEKEKNNDQESTTIYNLTSNYEVLKLELEKQRYYISHDILMNSKMDKNVNFDLISEYEYDKLIKPLNRNIYILNLKKRA